MKARRVVVAVVDDDPAVLRGVARLIGAFGYVAATFDSAEAFLDGGADVGAECLILDIHLGGMSGIELKHYLSASGCRLPVIFITAVDDARTHKEAKDSGCIACLMKPFSAERLSEAIRKAMS